MLDLRLGLAVRMLNLDDPVLLPFAVVDADCLHFVRANPPIAVPPFPDARLHSSRPWSFVKTVYPVYQEQIYYPTQNLFLARGEQCALRKHP